MRNIENFKIDDVEVTVKELTGEDMLLIYEMFKNEKQGFLNKESLLKNIDKILPLATNLKKDQFLKFAPSDMLEIWNKFKEVNAVFFSTTDFMISKLNLNELWIEARKTLAEFYLQLYSSYIDKVLQTAKNGDMVE